MKRYTLQQHIFILAFWVVGLVGGPGYAQSLTASVAGEVYANEPFQLRFTLDGAIGQISMPKISGVEVLGGPSTSQSMQYVNGRMSQSMTYALVLRAQRPGTITIGEARAEVNGEVYTSEPLQVEVKPARDANTANPNNQAPGGQNVPPPDTPPDAEGELTQQLRENVFLRAIPSKTRVVEGEQVAVTYKLYTRASLTDLQEKTAPSFNGFLVEDVDIGNVRFEPEIYRGQRFNVATVRQVILFPQRAGEFTLEPYQLNTQVRVVASAPRNSRNLFDQFFNRYRDVAFEVVSSRPKIRVSPLPAQGQPKDFNGVVGQFEVKADLSADSAETGKGFTYSVRIDGSGNLRLVQAPELDFPPDFDVFDPEARDRYRPSGGELRGFRSFDYLVVPQNPGEYELPEVKFAYYDPKAGRYYEKKAGGGTIRVTGEPMAVDPGSAAASKENVELLNESIRFISTDSPRFRKAGESFLGSVLFWLLLLLPIPLFIASILFYRQRRAAAADVVGTRRKKAGRVASRRLAEARGLRDSGSIEAFYDAVMRALWGYLGDKLNLPPSELDRARVSEVLAQREVSPELRARLDLLLESGEMVLYAPGAAASAETTYAEASAVINELEDSPLSQHP